MWINRLPPDYRRRYYTNIAILCGLGVFIFVVTKLGPGRGTVAIAIFLIALALYGLVFPLVRLLCAKPRPPRAAFIIYGIWIGGYAVAAIGLTFQFPALVVGGFLLAIVAMSTCLIAYRKIIFPSFSGGEFQKRLTVIREARDADRKERDAFIESLHKPDS
jgi:hypothetical protein